MTDQEEPLWITYIKLQVAETHFRETGEIPSKEAVDAAFEANREEWEDWVHYKP